jgi:hypothetical protein
VRRRGRGGRVAFRRIERNRLHAQVQARTTAPLGAVRSYRSCRKTLLWVVKGFFVLKLFSIFG